MASLLWCRLSIMTIFLDHMATVKCCVALGSWQLHEFPALVAQPGYLDKLYGLWCLCWLCSGDAFSA
jgi:hypothetical protein